MSFTLSLVKGNGQAIPLAFMFATNDGTAKEGTKDLLLRDSVEFIAGRCTNVKFTLSDKDASEISACRAEMPEQKHQLCYWHGIRYIERRLGENKPPAAYDPRRAHMFFPFIDPSWAPGVTEGNLEEGVHPDDAYIPLPKIKINPVSLTARAVPVDIPPPIVSKLTISLLETQLTSM